MSNETRFDRLANEVVSGGTQREAAAPTPAMKVIGIAAWVLMFVVLYLYSPWYVVVAGGLVVAVVLHEFGHFWTARKSGMKTTQFFLGFGPRIWSIHRGEMEYGVRAIPLGGFVKIIGMTNVDDVDPADEPRTYRQGTFPRRMWVITAGSVMHLIVAVVLITGVYAFAGQFKESGRVTLISVSADTPAAVAGLRSGDVVATVDGVAMRNSADFRAKLAGTAPGTEVTLGVVRGSQPLTIVAKLAQSPAAKPGEQRGFLGVRSDSRGWVHIGVAQAVVQGPKDLFVGVGQATVAIARIINPVNIFGHLVGSNTDVATRPGTVIGAVRVSKDVGRQDGWAGELVLLANLNLVLGVINMFPLMPLDGGHAAIAIYERLRSRKGKRHFADVNKLMPVAAACLLLISFMFITGAYLDIAKPLP